MLPRLSNDQRDRAALAEFFLEHRFKDWLDQHQDDQYYTWASPRAAPCVYMQEMTGEEWYCTSEFICIERPHPDRLVLVDLPDWYGPPVQRFVRSPVAQGRAHVWSGIWTGAALSAILWPWKGVTLGLVERTSHPQVNILIERSQLARLT